MITKKIGIIGCGNMGEALFDRLCRILEKSTRIMVSEMDAGRRDYIQGKYRIIVEIDNNLVIKNSDVIIIAVKPQNFEELFGEICCGMTKDKLLISIAAGISTQYIEKLAKEDVPVVRVMPNMPAIIGEAVSTITAGKFAKKEHMDITQEIFSTIGEVIEIDERLVDAVTAVSGSGPAYFFYLMESLEEAAKELGLSDKAARALVVKTALGSAKLLDELKESPANLRAKVASKGGTTEAAVKVFDSKNMKTTIKEAVKAACKRSKELSKG